MENNYQEMNLKPNVRTMAVTGGTAAGKSEVTSIMAAKKARSITSKTVGETNSTLKERLNVYSEAFTDTMLVAVKLNTSVYERQDFIDILVNALTQVVKSSGKIPEYDPIKLNDDFAYEMKHEVSTKVNTRAILTFLTDEQEAEFISNLVSIISESDFYSKNFKIYNTVKNNLVNMEVKDNSAKFISAIKSEIEKELDQMNEQFKNKLWSIWEQTNTDLKEVFFRYFDEKNVSKDGYYFKVIDLDNPDDEFVNALFTPNDLRNGGKLSLEVFCSEIVIYTPIHESIANLIKNNSIARDVFMDKNGYVTIGMYDTRGLYHADATDDENTEYFSELLYGILYDALIIVHPLMGDTNEAKLRELYSKALRRYNKQIPIFILNNKVDLYINSLIKAKSSDDPFSNDVPEVDLDINEIKKNISIRVNGINEEIKNVQSKNRNNSKLVSVVCWLKKDSSIKPELLKEYNVINAIDKIITEMGNYLKNTSVKIKFKLINEESSQIEPIIMEEQFNQILKRYLSAVEVDKKVFSPGLINLGENLGKTPHGNGYNAMRRRLRNGESYTSNIDEKYFYNCNSFTINFTGTLRNFISDSLIKEAILNAIEYKGGSFIDENAMEMISKIAVQYFNAYEFVAKLLYERALISAEKNAFSFKAKFNNFIQNSIPYFNRGHLNESDYEEVLKQSLLTAINRAIDLHVLYV